jgi:hypothetical protein
MISLFKKTSQNKTQHKSCNVPMMTFLHLRLRAEFLQYNFYVLGRHAKRSCDKVSSLHRKTFWLCWHLGMYERLATYIYVCIYICVCMYVYICIYIYVYIYVCIYICIYIWYDICIYVYDMIYVYMYTWIYIYICTHLCVFQRLAGHPSYFCSRSSNRGVGRRVGHPGFP